MKLVGLTESGNYLLEVTPEEFNPPSVFETSSENLGAQVKLWRAQRSLSQGSLAKLAGLSRNRIVAIESGHANVTLKSLRKICAALRDFDRSAP